MGLIFYLEVSLHNPELMVFERRSCPLGLWVPVDREGAAWGRRGRRRGCVQVPVDGGKGWACLNLALLAPSLLLQTRLIVVVVRREVSTSWNEIGKFHFIYKTRELPGLLWWFFQRSTLLLETATNSFREEEVMRTYCFVCAIFFEPN